MPHLYSPRKMQLIQESQIKNEWDIMEIAENLRIRLQKVNAVLREKKIPEIQTVIRDPYVEEDIKTYIAHINNTIIILLTKIQLSLKQHYTPQKKQGLNPSASVYVPPHKR